MISGLKKSVPVPVDRLIYTLNLTAPQVFSKPQPHRKPLVLIKPHREPHRKKKFEPQPHRKPLVGRTSNRKQNRKKVCFKKRCF